MSELGRVALGLPLAALLPHFVPWVQAERPRVAALAAVIAAWTLYPLGVRPALWGVAAGIVLLQAVPTPRSSLEPETSSPRVSLPLLGAAAAALATVLVADHEGTGRALETALEDDRGLAVTLGLLVAVFPIGALIGRLTGPWARSIEAQLVGDEASPRGLEGAGRYIGWLERAAIFAAIVLGAPEAVAVIFTAKSIARFPSFANASFAEYYLIGTLLSVIGGAGAAIATRLALGLSPL